MRNIILIILSIIVVGISSCNTEEGLVPASKNSYIKIIKGKGSETPLKIEIISDQQLLVLSNNRITVEGNSYDKIRVLKLNLEGDVVDEAYFPEGNDQNWKASDAIIVNEDKIIIGGTGTVGDSSLIFLSINSNLEETARQIYKSDAYKYSLTGMSYDDTDNSILFGGSEISNEDEFTIYGKINLENFIIQNPFKTNKARELPATALFRDNNGRLNWAYNSTTPTLVRSNSMDLKLIEDADFLDFSNDENIITKKLIGSDEGIFLFGELQRNQRIQLFQYKAFSSNPIVFGEDGNNRLNGVKKIENGYLITGTTEISNEGASTQRDFFIAGPKAGGVFTKSFGSDANEELHDAVMLNNKIYTIGSTIIGFDNSLLLIKLNEFGELKN